MLRTIYPANIYLFKDDNRNTRKRCEICSKLAIKTPETSIVDFEQVNVSWVWSIAEVYNKDARSTVTSFL